MSGSVAWITIAPVKALALESLEEVELAEGGPVGDRRFFLVDETGRLVNNKGLGILQQVRPVYDEADRTLELSFPDGAKVRGEVSLGDEIETAFWGITLPARLVVGPWSDALSDLAGKSLRLVDAGRPAVDRGRGGAASLVSTASLAVLARGARRRRRRRPPLPDAVRHRRRRAARRGRLARQAHRASARPSSCRSATSGAAP